MDPSIIAALISTLGGAGLSLFGGGNRLPRRERRLQKQQSGMIDDILLGLNEGTGPFADLFRFDEQGFQNRIADPLLNTFNNQVAPQIQQKFISSGQQRGTPIQTSLTRGGMNVQDNINQMFSQFQSQGQQNVMNALGKVLGFNFSNPNSGGGGINPLLGGAAGFLSGGGPDAIAGLFNKGQTASTSPFWYEGDDLFYDMNSYGSGVRRGF